SLDREWVEQVRKIKRPKLFIVNKVDSEAKVSYIADFYELGLDDLVPVSAETGRGVGDLLDRVNVILRAAPEGSVLERGRSFADAQDDKEFKIAIIGRPNVGKSTLLNRLIGEERAIVDEKAGTTRDPVDCELIAGDEKFRLIDTAGIRRRGRLDEAIEKFSVIKSLKMVEECDLALLLLDAGEGVTDQDAHVAGEAFKRSRALIFLVNKWDLEEETEKTREEFIRAVEFKLTFVAYCPVLFISAKTGAGVKKIIPTIQRIKDQYQRRVSTSALNDEFARIVDAHPLPVHAGRNIKIFYATQTGVAPPTFVIFSNEPKHIHFSYQRYLINSIREAFAFKEVPIKVLYRKRD
ncbi:MAG: ribosome biogenesis GTPase Der, partial [Deltaproteobacteria bacterium]|nr:ribosome biogenesis GTPase Der [Deltaproteobacteria bacterium]